MLCSSRRWLQEQNLSSSFASFGNADSIFTDLAIFCICAMSFDLLRVIQTQLRSCAVSSRRLLLSIVHLVNYTLLCSCYALVASIMCFCKSCTS